MISIPAHLMKLVLASGLLLLTVHANSHRQRPHHRAGIDAIESSESSVCANMWYARLAIVCKYPAQKDPCFTNEDQTELIDKIVFKCCNGGCGKTEMHDFCCAEQACLTRCYDSIRSRKHSARKELLQKAGQLEGRMRRAIDGHRRSAPPAADAAADEWAEVDEQLLARAPLYGLTSGQVREFRAV